MQTRRRGGPWRLSPGWPLALLASGSAALHRGRSSMGLDKPRAEVCANCRGHRPGRRPPPSSPAFSPCLAPGWVVGLSQTLSFFWSLWACQCDHSCGSSCLGMEKPLPWVVAGTQFLRREAEAPGRIARCTAELANQVKSRVFCLRRSVQCPSGGRTAGGERDAVDEQSSRGRRGRRCGSRVPRVPPGKANRSSWQQAGLSGELLGVTLGTQLPDRVSLLSEQKARWLAGLGTRFTAGHMLSSRARPTRDRSPAPAGAQPCAWGTAARHTVRRGREQQPGRHQAPGCRRRRQIPLCSPHPTPTAQHPVKTDWETKNRGLRARRWGERAGEGGF